MVWLLEMVNLAAGFYLLPKDGRFQSICLENLMAEQASANNRPGIGAYWYGPELSWLERACLRSMLAQGHQVTLFTHEKVNRIPEGIQLADAREITGDRPVVFNSKHASPSLFSNQFRYHMIEKTGLVWLDMDMFLLKSLKTDDGYLFAYESDTAINSAVLSLPLHSPTLQDLIEFCEDDYPIPPFFAGRRRFQLAARQMIGFPVHVSRLKWGVWGPQALTWFLQKNQESGYALKKQSLYPIRDKNIFFLPGDEVRELYIKDAVSVHLYGRGMRKRLKETGLQGIPKDSFLWEMMQLGQ